MLATTEDRHGAMKRKIENITRVFSLCPSTYALTVAIRLYDAKGLPKISAAIKRKFRYMLHQGLPGGSNSKASVYNVGDLGSIPGSGRSPGEGNGSPLQYYGL